MPHEKATRLVHPALILSVLSIASFLAQLDVWITNVGLPSIDRGVGAGSLSDLSWVLSGYATCTPRYSFGPAGRLVDRFGHEASFAVGLTTSPSTDPSVQDVTSLALP